MNSIYTALYLRGLVSILLIPFERAIYSKKCPLLGCQYVKLDTAGNPYSWSPYQIHIQVGAVPYQQSVAYTDTNEQYDFV